MTNLIVIVILIALVGSAGLYIYREKKRGVKCIGCPQAGKCAAKRNEASACSGSCAGCCGHADAE